MPIDDNNGNDSNKVHSKEYGNSLRKILKTGLTRTEDAINNIYDLAGNMYEWTSESYLTENRVFRGGYCTGRHAPSYRQGSYQFSNDGTITSRLQLYIK